MRRVHPREKRVGTPVGLEVRIDELSGRVVELILVGVDEIGIGMDVEQQRRFEERIRSQEVVVIEQTDEIPIRDVECGIGRTRKCARCLRGTSALHERLVRHIPEVSAGRAAAATRRQQCKAPNCRTSVRVRNQVLPVGAFPPCRMSRR
jgi:hypothetical protein